MKNVVDNIKNVYFFLPVQAQSGSFKRRAHKPNAVNTNYAPR